MNKNIIIGIDIAKKTFYLVKLHKEKKEIVERKKCNRTQLVQYLTRQESCTIAMEACGTSHFWGRKILELGHEVKLLPAQHVKAYLRGQKNDYNDAAAIAEACEHGKIRAVEVKSLEQQDEQTFMVMRRHVSDERTCLINHIRGLLAEYGIVKTKGAGVLRKELPFILEDVENGLTFEFRVLLERQYSRLLELDDELDWYNKQLELKVKKKETCRRLMEIPGVGPVVSFQLSSWMGDGKQFKRGRDAAAALGVVPRQHSTGGKTKLLGISKRGDKHLRAIVIHGARAAVSRMKEKKDKLSVWINRLIERRGFNRAVVAMANKIIRISWVIVCRGEKYQEA